MLASALRHRAAWFLLGSATTILQGCGANDKSTTAPRVGATGGTSGTAEDASAGKNDSGIIVVGAPDARLESCDGGRLVKVDLLFMIDNSSSMADKQAILALAVPDLVNRFLDPVCVDPSTFVQVGTRRPDGTCEIGIVDFEPVKDMHIGIITSSLGGQGAAGVCDDPDPRKTFPHNDDRGHLVARNLMDGAVATFQNQGFLNWNPAAGSGGITGAADLIAPFQTMVTGVGQHGCGYEAQLESIYRFLIDPDPYESVKADTTTNPPIGLAVLQGTDTVLLRQRADFLRPDSLVAVIAVTDENDCSIVAGGQGFYPLIPSAGNPPTSILGHGTATCLTNPNDKCCYNCGQPTPPGCPDKAVDAECRKGAWTRAEDPENLRCWQQKRRYGVDFLYPVQRYVDGFKSNQVPDRTGRLVQNPLYAAGRDKGLVFFAGIVGVPWQDIAVDPSDLAKGYLTAKQISDGQVWAKILGDPSNANGPVPPSDAHMIESIVPRAGLAGPGSMAATDPIHGHEWDTSMAQPVANGDLQYACTFELTSPKPCMDGADCDCFVPAGGNPANAKNPLCQDRGTGQYSTTQRGAKAYPGLRELEVLRGLGEQAIVGSICANSHDMSRPDFGYRPAIAAILKRLRPQLNRCDIVR